MISFLLIYKWSWLAALLAGSALSIFGAQLASRNQAVQTLFVNQGAAFGIILGVAFSHVHGTDSESALAFWPTVTGLTAAAGAFLFCELGIPRGWPARSSYFISLYALLLSITFIVITLVPNLEAHMALSFFGDISVASDHEAKIIAGLGLICLLIAGKNWRPMVRMSFDQVIFGQFHAAKAARRTDAIGMLLWLILITACVQFLGLLFTLSCLFIPVVILSILQSRLSWLFTKLVLSSALGVTLGLFFSLWHGNLPTSPTLSISIFIVSFIVGGFRR